MRWSLRRAGRERIDVEDFDDFTVVREPAGNVVRLGFAGGSDFGVDQFALAGDRNGDPFFSWLRVCKYRP